MKVLGEKVLVCLCCILLKKPVDKEIMAFPENESHVLFVAVFEGFDV